MKTGYSYFNINPVLGSPIVGYYEKRNSKGVIDNLYVRTLVFDDGEKKAAIIALDLCYLPQDHYDELKHVIHDATGIALDAIYITCSHTHTGPLVGKDFASDIVSDKWVWIYIRERAKNTAEYAVTHLYETNIEYAQTEAKGISFIRRYKMKDGSVATNPGVNNENIDCALGTPNETVKLVKLVREGADDLFIVNFGTHPDSVGGEYISADYMGYVCSTVENALPGTKCMFVLGAQGDVNHVNVHPTAEESAISKIDFDGVPRSIEHAKHMGRVIAGAVLSVCSVTKKIKADKINFGTSVVELPSNQENERLEEARKIYDLYNAGKTSELPYTEMELTTVVAEATRIVNLENGPESFPYNLSAIKVGELVFAGIGGEPFTEIGNRICETSPFEYTVLTCLTNNAAGYIPTSKAYDEGGYEARSSSLKRGGDDVIVNGMKDLLSKL